MRPIMYKVISVRRVDRDLFEDTMLKTHGVDVPDLLDDSFESRYSRRSRVSDVSNTSFTSTGTTRSQLREDRHRLESELDSVRSSIRDLEHELFFSSSSLSLMERSKNVLDAEVDQLRAANIRLLESNRQLESDKLILKSNMDRLQARMQAIIVEMSNVASSVQEKKVASQLTALTKSHDDLKRNYGVLEARLESLARENTTLKKQSKAQDERYAKDTSSLEVENRQLVAKLDKSDRLVVDQSQYIGHLKGQIRELEAFLSSERDEVRGLEDTLRHVKNELDARKKTGSFYDALRSRIAFHLNDEEPPVSASSTLARENAYAPSSAAARRPLPARPDHDYEELSTVQRMHRPQ